MTDERFRGLSNEELADIWYALSGAEIRHTGRYEALVDATLHELEERLPQSLRRFLDERFKELRVIDAPEDAIANLKSKPVVNNLP